MSDFINKIIFSGPVMGNAEIKTSALDVRKHKEFIIQVDYVGLALPDIAGTITMQFATTLGKGGELTDILEADWRNFDGMPLVFAGPDTAILEDQNGNFGAIRFILKSTNANGIDFKIYFNGKPIHTI
jgi:hypothetical protein